MSYVKDPPNALYAWVGAFVDELARSGIQDAIVSPGSRSTPLALALAAEPRLTTRVLLDERSAAFFALGLAKASQRPVVLVCTSGTAAANYLPAIAEAHLTHLPLIVLTADRPHELRDDGAPQTIDQIRLYGNHVHWFVDLPLPEATDAALRYIRTIADRAVATAANAPAGPVHLNFPLREPLVPAPGLLPPVATRDPVAWQGRADDRPYCAVLATATAPLAPAVLAEWEICFRTTEKGLILAGPGIPAAAVAPLLAFAETVGYPILADPLSGVRFAERASPIVLASYDALLRDADFVATSQPDIILRFGALPTAKPVLQFLQRYPAVPTVIIDPGTEWNDPTQLASAIVRADPLCFCRDLRAALLDATVLPLVKRDSPWLARWQRAEVIARAALAGAIARLDRLFEGRIFLALRNLFQQHGALMLSNSMPVRDADTFLWPRSDLALRVFGNRGANGIDGVISTALGISAADAGPTVLVIGDLAFYHDMNGLLAAKLYGLDLTIILVNNDGGGIFSFLPQAEYPEHFERLFGTPTGLDFAHVAALYGAIYACPADWTAFDNAVRAGMEQGGLHIIELRTDRETNVTMHRHLWPVVTQALRDGEIIPQVEGGPR